ncbi:MAG: PilZ domain-containing protein [Planctomycetota bacterium]
MRERREFARHPIAGNLEITSVIGGAEPPSDVAEVLNCSRSGVLFRLPAPSRGFFRKRAAAPLRVRDSITCVLRLAPDNEPLEMFGEVVRSSPDPLDEAQLEVALRFFHDVSRRSVMNPQHDVLGRLLEPEKLAAEAEAERQRKLDENAARRSARAPKQAQEEEEPLSCSEAARLVSQTSQRLKVRAAQEEEQPLSCSEAAALVSKTSQRLRAQSRRVARVEPEEEEPLSCSEAAALVSKTSQRLKRASDSGSTQRLRAASARHAVEPSAAERAAAVTQRLRRASGRHEAAASQRLRRPSSRIGATSGRLSAKASQRLEQQSLDTSTLRRLDESQLLESNVRTPTLARWAQTRLHIASEPRLLDLGGQLGIRGRAVLRSGVAVVAFPDAFAARVEAEGLTVHLTPRGPAALYVSEVHADRIVVEAVQRGEAPLEFDYLVLADRGASLRA